MTSWRSYPKIYNLGHPLIKDLLDGDLVVEEKIDGSQFSFGVFDGEIRVRSKGKEMDPVHPEQMFLPAVQTVLKIAHFINPGWTYSGEFLSKPKHNTLAYDRAPIGGIILFDIRTGEETYLTPAQKAIEAVRLGLDCVPTLEWDRTHDGLIKLLETPSCLGGQKIEGVVIKNYSKFGPDGKALMGKFVSEDFKEVHKDEWRDKNPTNNDILLRLIAMHRTPARWEKAVQHLNELGGLEHSPRDIGLLMQEVHSDIDQECSPEIANILMNWAMPKVKRGSTSGLAEWYKKKLLEEQFNEDS